LGPVKNRSLLATVLLVAVTTPGVGASAAVLKVALLPVERVNITPAQGRRYLDLLLRGLRQRSTLEILRPGTAGGSASLPARCSESIDCLRREGLRLGADRLLQLRVGQLGDTTIVRLTAFDVARGARQGSWQEVLRDVRDAAVAQALERMIAGFAPAPPPVAAKKSWYTRWWVWTVAGAVVAGTVTAIVLGTRDTGPERDRTIIFP